MELFDHNNFELDPETRALMEATIEALPSRKDSSDAPEVSKGPITSINELDAKPYEYKLIIPNEQHKIIDLPTLYGENNERPLKPFFDIDSLALQSRLTYPEELLHIPVNHSINYKKNIFPVLSDLLPPLTKESVADIDPLTSPNYQLVALTLGVMIGREELTPIYDQLHSEVYGVTE